MRDGYLARWQGREWDAAPDGDSVRLYADAPAEGFIEVRPGRFRRVVRHDDVDELVYLRTRCTWRDQPFIALGVQAGWVRLEYVGGRREVAVALGLEEFDIGVHQGWAPLGELTDVREERI
ncbi:hypothetical protein [Pilimelia columellifera]|uniref:Uncharacterized protein n=1 Tax=Pilimelia columellifera subsp. columellifera TaxID=706583 RepID=A0ABP6A6T5_9ACTN